MEQHRSKPPVMINGLTPQRPTEPRDAAAPPTLTLDPRTYDRATDCIHCGLCLPACPTYLENGLEADSPRGRIMLMKGLADGDIDATASVVKHLDLCLDCRGCETACPSGVVYHELIEETRAKLDAGKARGWATRVVDVMTKHIFTHPTRLKLSLLPVRLLQHAGLWGLTKRVTGPLLPPQLRKMQGMLPEGGAVWERRLKPRSPSGVPDASLDHSLSVGVEKRGSVAMFAGCVGSVLFQGVNRQAADLLAHAGMLVAVPRAQGCCGAIHHHGGDWERAARFARENIDAFCPTGEEPPKYVVNTIAGCGAMLKEYPHLLRDDPAYAERARDFSSRVRDVSEALDELDAPAPEHDVCLKATYHDACHLAHAQGVRAAPRRLLSRIRGLELVPLAEAELCCGAAGTYNLTQPEMATRLGQRKLDRIRGTGAGVCVTGNVGCAMQIESEARRVGMDLEVVHPVTLLHRATFGDT